MAVTPTLKNVIIPEVVQIRPFVALPVAETAATGR
jgi:hypothetical protein